MKAPLQPAKTFGSAASSVTAQRKGLKTITDNRPSAIAQRKLQGVAQRNNSGNSTIQMFRIKLKDEDNELMAELRQVPIRNEGNQAMTFSKNLDDFKAFDKIGKTENIILEGHGNTNGNGLTLGQGGWTPGSLAKIAASVSKPEDWSGSIILLGCATGGIAQEVSTEYYNQTQKAVSVIGTLKNVRAAKDSKGENFAGYDWKHYPENERPRNYSIAKKMEAGLEYFHEKCIAQLRQTIRDMRSPDDKSAVLPYDLSTMEQDAHKLIPAETISQEYKYEERLKFLLEFKKIIGDITKDATFHTGRILTVKNNAKGLLEIRREAIDSLKKFILSWNKEYLVLLQQARGMLLKPIDFSNADHIKQSRMDKEWGFIGYFQGLKETIV